MVTKSIISVTLGITMGLLSLINLLFAKFLITITRVKI